MSKVNGSGKVVMLQAEDAQVTTATITIKAIQVGKRQMTQSVFRQLPEAAMVDEVKLELNGVPWGWVNYRWGDIPEAATHFIFQKGTTLHRCAFAIRASSQFAWEKNSEKLPTPFYDDRDYWRETAEMFHLARIFEGWRPEEKAFVGSAFNSAWDVRLSATVFGPSIVVGMPTTIYGYSLKPGRQDEALQRAERDHAYFLKLGEGKGKTLDQYQAEYLARNEAETEGAMEKLANLIGKKDGRPLPAAEFQDRMRQVEREAEDYCHRWDRLMDQLRAVEQLYIAC